MYKGLQKFIIENRRTRIYGTCTGRKTQSPPQVSCFSSQFPFLPLGDASVCNEKMAAPGEKSFCVLEYLASKCMVTEQRAFRTKYAKDPSTDKTIRAWYKQFTETGCLCKQKTSGQVQELEYRIDVWRVTPGAHIEHLYV